MVGRDLIAHEALRLSLDRWPQQSEVVYLRPRPAQRADGTRVAPCDPAIFWRRGAVRERPRVRLILDRHRPGPTPTALGIAVPLQTKATMQAPQIVEQRVVFAARPRDVIRHACRPLR